jgi:hypothetical protein
MPPADIATGITVAADEVTCMMSSDSVKTGHLTFRVTDGGRRVTEFYV